VEPVAIPYVFHGKKHTYYPDLLITYRDGSCELVEIKPERMRNNALMKTKNAAARRWCKKKHYSWRVVGYRELAVA
jgi:hypothetical protein